MRIIEHGNALSTSPAAAMREAAFAPAVRSMEAQASALWHHAGAAGAGTIEHRILIAIAESIDCAATVLSESTRALPLPSPEPVGAEADNATLRAQLAVREAEIERLKGLYLDDLAARLAEREAELDEAVRLLEPFAQAGRVVDFYVAEALPDLTFPKPGIQMDSDGPPPTMLAPSDFSNAAAFLSKHKENT